jgi:beta-galactosidase
MRTNQLFNQDWLFATYKVDLEAPDECFEAIDLPHSNKVFPHHNFDNQEYQFVSTYRKRFSLPRDRDGRLVFLDFDAVMLACTVYVNGKLVEEHLGGFAPFSVNITDYLLEGENTLTVYVDSTERPDVPPYGRLVDYLTFGGIYRDVYLRQVHPCHIENVFVRPQNVLDHPQLACEVRLNAFMPGLNLKATLRDRHTAEVVTLQGVVEDTVARLNFTQLPPVELWSLDHPNLYTVEFSLYHSEELLDTMMVRFGFREAEFRSDGGFYLNGERIKLFGLNRHQTYPYIGAAAPARLQRQDADILKYQLACNVVRTSHYPQSPHFLDRCDEIGLLVFEEMAGWQYIGDEQWQGLCLDELKMMIERDRNHPSIILWGVRINESEDNDAFYTRTNGLARQLDPSRQTGGVRCFLDSSFLEDVYTYNDFSNTVLEPTQQPYLITEFAGHKFPTKIWDHEERLIDHALLHARVQNLQMGNDRVAGAIGWCAFDYATHIEFGSGDRICYHGVMDIFRLPKWAAYLYQSQQAPTRQIVLQAATHWTMGDRSGGGLAPLTVFSNCDEIEVFIGEAAIGRFKPDVTSYPHLPHPPFTIDRLDEYSAWGQARFYDLHLVGYLDGKQVAEQWISSSRLPHCLELNADASQLYADGSDLTRLAFRITDKFGNPLPYATQVVTFQIEGEADLIGENPFALVGGQAALYLKARHRTGKVIIRAHSPGVPEASTIVELVPPVENF